MTLFRAAPLNAYGGHVIDPGQFMEAHVVNPMGPGLPPVCSCGWTPWKDEASGIEFTMADHIADMGEFVGGVPS